MINKLYVYSRQGCYYCTTLKTIIKRAIELKDINYRVEFLMGDPTRPVPYMEKYDSKGNVFTLEGLPSRERLYNYLEI